MHKMIEEEKALKASYDSRFLEDYLGGSMSNDPITAIVELIANAWDAGSRNVKITWPQNEDDLFSVVDDGHGLTAEQFSERWTKLSYNRLENQGSGAFIPEDNNIPNKRNVYGRNGKGRFSAFCFGSNTYFVETKTAQSHFCYKVQKSTGQNPLLYSEADLPEPSFVTHQTHGTAVYIEKAAHIGIPEDKIRSEIGKKVENVPFLKDFNVTEFLENNTVESLEQFTLDEAVNN